MLGTALLVGCAAQGVDVDPFSRSLSWFSYLGGEDVREQCFTDAPTRLRFVYNAVYTEQVRTYDVFADAGDTATTVKARAFGSANLVGLELDDPLAAWRGTLASAPIDGASLKALRRSLDDSGFFGPASEGLLLRSDSFYWAVSACLDGAFHFNAFAAPSAEFSRLRFLEILLPHDLTDVPVNPVRVLDLAPFNPNYYELIGRAGVLFEVQVGRNGLKVGRLFR